MKNSFVTLVLGLALISHGSCQQANTDVVSFAKRVYSALGTKSADDLADEMKGEYASLNHDGTLSEKLNGLYEMRLEDLHISVKHAIKMREFLDILDGNSNANAREFFDD